MILGSNGIKTFGVLALKRVKVMSSEGVEMHADEELRKLRKTDTDT